MTLKRTGNNSNLLILFFSAIVLWFFFGGGMDAYTDKSISNINRRVLLDEIEKYNIAARSGNAMQCCIQAMTVSAAHLQAKDEDGYKNWELRKKADCKKAGLPV